MRCDYIPAVVGLLAGIRAPDARHSAEDQASRLSAAADEADRSARDPDEMARQEPREVRP